MFASAEDTDAAAAAGTRMTICAESGTGTDVLLELH
jgi:hypothetical protein